MSESEGGDLGWDARWRGLFEALAPPGAVPARVVRVNRGRVDVKPLGPTQGSDADTTWSVESPGIATSVGDWAVVDGDRVVGILPRRSELVRAAADGTSGGHVLAANVDVGIIVEPALSPALGRLERLQALVWQAGAQPVVVLTKSDLVDSPGETAERLASELGCPVHALSALNGDGLEQLRAQCGVDEGGRSQTFVLLGPSGAGKSTLLNAFAGREVMATGAVRATDAKGRHTTTHRELTVVPGLGVLIDTPGLRAVGVVADDEALSATFADIDALAQQCRFADCAHASEPGCAVRGAVDEGALSARRLDSYRRMVREAARQAQRHDAFAGRRARVAGRERQRAVRVAMRAKGR